MTIIYSVCGMWPNIAQKTKCRKPEAGAPRKISPALILAGASAKSVNCGLFCALQKLIAVFFRRG